MVALVIVLSCFSAVMAVSKKLVKRGADLEHAGGGFGYEIIAPEYPIGLDGGFGWGWGGGWVPPPVSYVYHHQQYPSFGWGWNGGGIF